ncbi:hypothetical protein Tco_1404590 [Tanacetum coccineum]
MNQTQGNSKEVGTPRYLSLVVPLRKVGDEAVHKELGDRMERAATTASSSEAEQDSGSGPRCQDTILGDVDAQTRFETTSEQSNDPPLSKVNTFGSGEDSMKILELMEILYTKLSNSVEERVIWLLGYLLLLGITFVPVSLSYCAEPNFSWLPVQDNAAEGRFKNTFDSCRRVWVGHSQHVASKEKPAERDGFHEIIDFLNANQIRYALTVNPTIYTSCIKQFSAIEKAKTVNGERKETQAKEIADLKKRVQKLERKKKSRTTGLKRLRKLSMSRRFKSSVDKDRMTLKDIDKDADVSLVDDTQGRSDDAKMFDTNELHGDEVVVDMLVGEKQEQSAKEKETIPQESQPSKIKDKGKAIMIEPEVPLKRKDQVALDEDLARNLQAPEEKAKGSKKKILGKKRAGKGQQQESSKRQRIEDDKETDEHEEVEVVYDAELKKHLVIVKDDDIAINAIPLATKPPVIVEYKLLKEGIMVHYQLIRADEVQRYSSKMRCFKVIGQKDLQTLWKLVKTKHGDTRPEDEHERVL